MRLAVDVATLTAATVATVLGVVQLGRIIRRAVTGYLLDALDNADHDE